MRVTNAGRYRITGEYPDGTRETFTFVACDSEDLLEAAINECAWRDEFVVIDCEYLGGTYKDGERFCDRHGGEWGGDETCEQCTDEDGNPRT